MKIIRNPDFGTFEYKARLSLITGPYNMKTVYAPNIKYQIQIPYGESDPIDIFDEIWEVFLQDFVEFASDEDSDIVSEFLKYYEIESIQMGPGHVTRYRVTFEKVQAIFDLQQTNDMTLYTIP